MDTALALLVFAEVSSPAGGYKRCAAFCVPAVGGSAHRLIGEVLDELAMVG
jgi:hypothetical protein